MSKLQNNKELVRVGHEFAKAMGADTPLIEIAKMVSRLAERLDCTTAALHGTQAQRDLLAAENAGLKNYRPQPQGAAMMEALDAFYEHEDVPEQGMMNAFEILCCKRPETLATDDFIAEQRVQGVEMMAERKNTEMMSLHPDTHAVRSIAAEMSSQVKQLREFAAQLRKGAAA